MLRKIKTYAGLLNGPRDRGPAVCALAYHSVGSSKTPLTVAPAVFEQHMRWVKEFGYPISGAQLREFLDGAELPPRPVLVTFDDGYRDNLTSAAPILRRHAIPALIFVCTGFVGAKLPLYAEMLPALSWEDIRELHQTAAIEFGAHTRTHPRLSEVPLDVARKTIRDSKRDIERVLETVIHTFSYPQGRFNDAVVEIVRQEGFRIAFGGEGCIRRSTPPLLLPRVQVDSAASVDALAWKISSCFSRGSDSISFSRG